MSRGCVFEADDLLSLIELARGVAESSILPLDNDGRPLPLRLSVGDALGGQYVAHVEINPGDREPFFDFTPEERQR